MSNTTTAAALALATGAIVWRSFTLDSRKVRRASVQRLLESPLATENNESPDVTAMIRLADQLEAQFIELEYLAAALAQ